MMQICLAPERLDEGPPEERAAFGLIELVAQGHLLTEGIDALIGDRRRGPLVSGYHLAEWLAWNWWRLRHEPRTRTRDWRFAHCLATIGQGYVWPNVTIQSDGFRTVLLSERSADEQASFRYLGAPPCLLPWTDVEAAIDAFVGGVTARLRDRAVADTNLDRIWRDLLAERADPDLVRYRRLEAALGHDPDELDERLVQARLDDAGRIGEAGLVELAAEAAQAGTGPGGMLTADRIVEISGGHGIDMREADAIILPRPRSADWGSLPAAQVAVAAARQLRRTAGLGSEPISDARLADLAGMPRNALEAGEDRAAPLTFAFTAAAGDTRVVFRRWRPESRRFDLARLIADRVLGPAEPLRPVTMTGRYRQKAQRAFAAEFLAPIDAVVAYLRGDLSDENQQEAAAEFGVSPYVINNLLKNNGIIERGAQDFDEVA